MKRDLIEIILLLTITVLLGITLLAQEDIYSRLSSLEERFTPIEGQVIEWATDGEE